MGEEVWALLRKRTYWELGRQLAAFSSEFTEKRLKQARKEAKKKKEKEAAKEQKWKEKHKHDKPKKKKKKRHDR